MISDADMIVGLRQQLWVLLQHDNFGSRKEANAHYKLQNAYSEVLHELLKRSKDAK